MPSSRRVRKTRTAISPLFATRTLENTMRILSRVTLADQLTVARAASAPVVVFLFAVDFPGHDYWGTLVFSVAMSTDWFDGRLARRSGRTSEVGSLLHPVA